MIAVITYHPVAQGRLADAESMVKGLTAFASKCKGYVSRQATAAKDDPLYLVNFTTWASMQDLDAFSARQKEMRPPSFPPPWSGPVTREVYDVFDAVELTPRHPEAAPRRPESPRGPLPREGLKREGLRPAITMVAVHYQDPKTDAEGRKRLRLNTEIAQGVPGLVRRQLIAPQGDPTRLTSVTTWTGEDAYKTWVERIRKAAAGLPQVWNRPVESRAYTVKGWD